MGKGEGRQREWIEVGTNRGIYFGEVERKVRKGE